jgi:manganese/zinc/iron transport system permease protein
VLGTYAVLRRQSLLGDAVAHTALPGLVLAFMLTGSKAPGVLLLGAALAGWVATLLISAVTATTRVKYDTALGLVLSVFFGFGLVLLTFVQKQADAQQAGLDKFLFGQASALVGRDVALTGAAGVLVIAVVLLFWKEFKLLGFDPAFGTALGYPMNLVDYLLTALLVLTIVLGLQTVGVVLMSAMVVMPAVAARQWTDRLGRMVLVAAIIGSLAGVSGTLWSSSTARMPTGPTIVVCLFALVVISLLFAPRHGLVFGRVAGRVRRKRLQVHAVLLDLHELSVQHSGAGHAHALAVLRSMNPAPATVIPTLLDLQARGWVEKSGGDLWRLTPTGADEARRVARSLEGRT